MYYVNHGECQVKWETHQYMGFGEIMIRETLIYIASLTLLKHSRCVFCSPWFPYINGISDLYCLLIHSKYVGTTCLFPKFFPCFHWKRNPPVPVAARNACDIWHRSSPPHRRCPPGRRMPEAASRSGALWESNMAKWKINVFQRKITFVFRHVH